MNSLSATNAMAEQPNLNTQPNPLPETLPAGTRIIGGVSMEYSSGLRNDGNYECRMGPNLSCWFAPCDIDWSSVPKREVKPRKSTMDDFRVSIGGVELKPMAQVSFESVVPATCRSCSSPPTHGKWCVYCAYSLGAVGKFGSGEAMRKVAMTASRALIDASSRNWMQSAEESAAALRMQRADDRERPRVTKDSIELAKKHPWSCDDV